MPKEILSYNYVGVMCYSAVVSTQDFESWNLSSNLRGTIFAFLKARKGFAFLAQMVEHLSCKQKVLCSIRRKGILICILYKATNKSFL